MKSPIQTNARPYILFVDDEELAQKYFRKAIESDFEVLTASSVADAVEMLGSNADKIGVVVTDQRMPKEMGTSLLRRINEDYPEIIRILTTAYSDLDSAIQAVNEGHIYRYITKPWDIRELQTVVRQAVDLFCLQREHDTLVAEKLSVIHRTILVDRAKTLCVLASALQPKLRHSLHAIRDYVAFVAQPGLVPDISAFAGWEDLWAGTVDETLSSVGITETVTDVLQPKDFESIDLGRLFQELGKGTEGIHIGVESLPDVLMLDDGIINVLIRRLLKLTADLWADSSVVELECKQSDDSTAVNISVAGPSNPRVFSSLAQSAHQRHWATSGPHLDLLILHLAANHHAGHVTVTADPNCPLAIEVHLPVGGNQQGRTALPDNWIEQLFDLLEH
ncbi:MAG: response regulator [Planctomycetota bacterium]